MRIYFSGGSGKTLPEGMIPDKQPHIMMTYYDIDKWYLARKKAKEANKPKPAPTTGPMSRIKAHLKTKSK